MTSVVDYKQNPGVAALVGLHVLQLHFLEKRLEFLFCGVYELGDVCNV
jgi:hypothetical protein